MATFETLAAKCAAGVALDLLVAIASVESSVHPLAVRDGTTLTRVASVGEGVALAIGAADQGRDARIGLMGLTERQLRAAGLTLAQGFDACASLTVAAGMIEASRATVRGQNVDAAHRVAIRAWWRSDGRFASIAAFEAEIARERGSAAVIAKRELAPTAPKQPSPTHPVETADGIPAPSRRSTPAAEPDCWNVFARQRAGFAQCEDLPRTAPAAPDPRVRHQQPETASVVIVGSRATP
jgi:type IV secretion system protein VirB1